MTLKWDAELRRWRLNGRKVTLQQQVGLRNELADLYSSYLRHEANLFVTGKLEYANWVANSEKYILDATGNGYTFGRGGTVNMTNSDYDRLARTLNKQVELFRGFADEVRAGNLSPLQIAARAESYGGSVVFAHEQAVNQAAIGDDPNADWELPFYPGDGETSCLSRCRCAWEIDEDEYAWTCTYHTMGDDQMCEDCIARGRQYGEGSPLVFPKANAPMQIRDLGAA